MNICQLQEKLLAEGCNPANFSIQSSGSDIYCLDKKDGYWAIFYTERGCDSEPIFKSQSEEEACQFYYDMMMKIEHWHIVGFFKEEAAAKALEDKLLSFGIRIVRNDIPAYNQKNDPRYRVFVIGKDIFRTREIMGEIVISYA